MTTERQRQLLDNLKDIEYRKAFADDHVGTGLAFQLRLLREARGWTQADLAKRTGQAQATISQLENPNYGRCSLSTLKKLAASFDVGLLVRFVPFSEIIDWTLNVSPQRLAPPSFEEEQRQIAYGKVEVSSGRLMFAANASTTNMEFPWNSILTGSIVYSGDVTYEVKPRTPYTVEHTTQSPTKGETERALILAA